MYRKTDILSGLAAFMIAIAIAATPALACAHQLFI